MELEILHVMKQAPGTRFSYKEIGKMIDRKQFREDAHWARPILEKLAFERLIWKEDSFYLYPTEEQRSEHRRTEGKVRSSGVQSHSLPEEK